MFSKLSCGIFDLGRGQMQTCWRGGEGRDRWWGNVRAGLKVREIGK